MVTIMNDEMRFFENGFEAQRMGISRDRVLEFVNERWEQTWLDGWDASLDADQGFENDKFQGDGNSFDVYDDDGNLLPG